MTDYIGQALNVWDSGGWLMWPLLALALFLYYTILRLELYLRGHFLVASGVDRMTDEQLGVEVRREDSPIAALMLADARSAGDVQRHFIEVRAEYLPFVARRIGFIARLLPAGPLMGLLGTVIGMLSTFSGMAAGHGDKFSRVIEGISEALITTQTGLIISIPAMVLLSMIRRRNNRLVHCIARLERYNTAMALRAGHLNPGRTPATASYTDRS